MNLNPEECLKELRTYELGYSNDEDAYYGYKREISENTAYLYEENGYIYVGYNEENAVFKHFYFVFTSLAEAHTYIESCQGIDSIEKQIDDFMIRTNHEFKVKVDKENDNGKFYSFKIYYDEDFLIYDGVFNLDDSIDDELIDAVELITNCIYETDVKIVAINHKPLCSPSWEEYYEVTFKNQNNSHVTIGYSLRNCIQPRNVVVAIMEALEIEDIQLDLITEESNNQILV